MDGTRSRAPAQNGFDGFVADTTERLLRSAYLITWDLADAEDLVQECLFKVARRWPRVRKMEHPAAYARKILVHLALDDGKHRNRRRAELHPDAAGCIEGRDDEAAARVLGRVETNADLLGALRRLPQRQRAALVLRYFDDLSEAETAVAMGCSIGTVKSTTARALERLREDVDRPRRGRGISGHDPRENGWDRRPDCAPPAEEHHSAALSPAIPAVHATTDVITPLTDRSTTS